MAKRNWAQLYKDWLEAGRPKLAQFSREKGIPIGTLRKQAIRHKWAEKGRLVESRVTEAVAETEAQQAAAFRKRMITIGQGLQAKALQQLQVTSDNAVHVLRLGAALEKEGVYGPAARAAAEAGVGVFIQQNTVNYMEAMRIGTGEDGQERQALARALEEYVPRRKT